MEDLNMSRADAERQVRLGARALARAGLVNAYGHCSVRLDADTFLICANRPLGCIASGERGQCVPIDGPLPPGALGETRVHQHIYRRRDDLGAICRVFPVTVTALSTVGITPAHRLGTSALFAAGIPVFNDARILKEDSLAASAATTLAGNRALVLRGNGAITVGRTMAEAAMFALFLEEAAVAENVARLQRRPRDLLLSAAEIEARGSLEGNIVPRMWEYLTRDDPEAVAGT